MKNLMTQEQIFGEVRQMVGECLAFDPEEIQMETNFNLDLGGESIDFLDLSFRIEKQLGLRSPITKLIEKERWTFDENGRPTQESLNRLKIDFPRVNWDKHLAVEVSDPKEFFTIELIVELVDDAQHQSATIHAPVISRT
jgi:acyl carrier protein